MKVLDFFKEWMLVIGMLTGISAYLIYYCIPALHPAGPVLLEIVKLSQPLFLFTMLFLSFSKVEPRQLKPHRWQLWLILIQAGIFAALSVAAARMPHSDARILTECAMLCMICPTATAAAVVTGRLGGNVAGIITYTIAINLVVAIIVPLFVPMVHPVEGIGFFKAFSMIIAKVFPLLICPCLLAWLVRYTMPSLHHKIVSASDFAFTIWAVSLVLALVMATRAVVHSGTSVATLALMALIALITCAFQFWAGKRIGRAYGDTITAGQSMGQKNTVFAIWMGYTFLDPVSSVIGGFYSIWHNIYNSWQLHQKGK